MENLRAILVLLGAGWLVLVTTIAVHGRLSASWRFSLLAALTIVGGLSWLIAEALGAVRAITLPALAIAWILAALAASLAAVRWPGQAILGSLRGAWDGLRDRTVSIPIEVFIQLGFILLSAGLLAVIAFAAAPNTWDSLTYHLSRVMHWQQDGSLAFFATPIQRQLAFGPLAEIGMLNYQILVGGDRLVNFVQYAAMVGCLVGVSLIAELAGGNLRAQVLAALGAATIPMGILQATSTQNDYVATLWCVCFAAFIIVQAAQGTSTPLIGLAGVAFGLAIDTKATALIFLPPIALWYAIGLLRRSGAAALRPIAAVVAIGAIILLPQTARNLGLFGNVLGTAPGPELGSTMNEVLSPRIWASNVVRGIATQLATPSAQINQVIDQGVRDVHAALGIDASSPLSTWKGARFQMVFTLHEDSANNPVHLILIVAAILALLLGRKTKALPLAASVVGGFLLLCIVLKWQPWNSRLELPLFMLAMPLVGVAASAFLPRAGQSVLALVLGLASLPYLLGNSSRPLIGDRSVLLVSRMQQYFYYPGVPDASAAYLGMAQALKEARCDRIGLMLGYDDREYLNWVTVKAYQPEAVLEHILVRNASSRYGTGFVPCGIVSTSGADRKTIEYEGREYLRANGGVLPALFLEMSGSSQGSQAGPLSPAAPVDGSQTTLWATFFP